MRASRANIRRSSPGLDQTTCVVLVVDDMADNRELYAAGLVRRGYAVIAAAEGAEAVEAVTLHRPAIVLMDLGMPVLDGFEATKQIRSLGEIAQPYIVALSAFTDRTSRTRALEAGCDEFLAKPLLPHELANRLDEIRKTREQRVSVDERTRAR